MFFAFLILHVMANLVIHGSGRWSLTLHHSTLVWQPPIDEPRTVKHGVLSWERLRLTSDKPHDDDDDEGSGAPSSKKIQYFDLQRRFAEFWAVFLSLFSPGVMIWWTGRWRCNPLLGSTGNEYAVRVMYCIIVFKIWLIAITEILGSAFYCTVCKQINLMLYILKHDKLWGGDN